MADEPQVADENFKDHPLTIGEIRSDKMTSAKAWKPRDALIQMLRAIDGGASISEMTICYIDDETQCANYLCATTDKYKAMGTISRVLQLVGKISEETE